MSPIKPLIFYFLIIVAGLNFVFMKQVEERQEAVRSLQVAAACCQRGDLIQEIPLLLEKIRQTVESLPDAQESLRKLKKNHLREWPVIR